MNDLVQQNYWTKMSLRNQEVANGLTNLLIMRSDEFLSTVLFGGKLTKNRNEKFDKEKPGKFIDCLMTSDVVYIVLTNDDRKKKDFIFGFTISFLKGFNMISFGVTPNYFLDEQNIEKYVSIGKQIIELINPVYGCIHDVRDWENVRRLPIDVFNRIPGAFWGNYFGRTYIAKIGEDKLLSAKFYKTEYIGNDGILVFTSKSPLTPDSKEDRMMQKQLLRIIN